MTREDLAQVMRIERASFDHPWPRASFEQELDTPISRSLVACPREDRTRVAGYVVRWSVADEIHLLNLATAPSARGVGLGRRLLRWLLSEEAGRDVGDDVAIPRLAARAVPAGSAAGMAIAEEPVVDPGGEPGGRAPGGVSG